MNKVNPRVTDDDRDSITVTLDGKELRQWSYANDAERRVKMGFAREYVEGWCDSRDTHLELFAMRHVETLTKAMVVSFQNLTKAAR